MKLKEFIIEKLIMESSFSVEDWTKTNHTYGQDVIDKLIGGSPVRLGDKGTDGEYTATPEEIEKLKGLKCDYSKDTLKQFNDIFDRKNMWQSIFKGDFSGYSTGNTEGQQYESLVCYLFNDNNADVDLWLQANGLTGDESWIESCRKTVATMNKYTDFNHKWTNEDYVACHVDGNDFKLGAEYEFARELTSIFSGKPAMRQLFGKNIENIYSGKGKDTWNKADIVLINKRCKNLLKEMKQVVSDGESLNNELLKQLTEGNIIPISLKKIPSNQKEGHIEKVNIDDAEDMNDELEKYMDGDIYISLPKTLENNRYQGTIDMLCSHLDSKYKISFLKATSGKNNLNVETTIVGSVSRAGKAVSNIKTALKLGAGNDYFVVMDDNDDAIRELKDYGFEIQMKKNNNLDKAEEFSPTFCERPCIAGLLGLLKQYEKVKHPEKKDFCQDFAEFVYMCSVKSSGAFYKLS